MTTINHYLGEAVMSMTNMPHESYRQVVVAAAEFMAALRVAMEWSGGAIDAPSNPNHWYNFETRGDIRECYDDVAAMYHAFTRDT